MASPMQVFRVKEFQGGRNSQASAHDLPPNQSPDDLNLDGSNPGSIKVRKGLTQFSSMAYGTDPITGLYPYYKSNGNRYLMVLCGNQLWAGLGTPPSNVLIKSDVTPGTDMDFATMQDWCYGSNLTDYSVRYDGTNIYRAGLPMPGTVSGTIGTGITSGGSQTDGKEYIYRVRFRYGKLGLSNLSIDLPNVTMSTPNLTGQLSSLDQLTPGNSASLIPSTAPTPTHIQFYRSLGLTAGTIAGLSDKEIYNQIPFYFVEELPWPQTSWDDGTADAELLVAYEGPVNAGSYKDNWSSPWNVGLEYHLQNPAFPQARYIEEHRNRMFYANCIIEDDEIDSADGMISGTYPSRVYWSDLYQPDRVSGFVEVFPEDGDEITGVISHQHVLIVFKRTKTYALLGSGPDNFEVRLLNGYVGCVAPRSIKPFENDIVFRGANNLYAYAGSSFQPIAQPIRDEILDADSTKIQNTAIGIGDGRFYVAVEE